MWTVWKLSDQSNIEELDDNELRKMLIQMDKLADQERTTETIETDDELHEWIKKNLGLDIPRVSVCPEHNAPFDLIADLFFERVDAAILMANRGGGKTYQAALWQFLNMKFTPEVECATVGAIEIQAKRAYSHFKTFQRKAGSDQVDSSLMHETIWLDGQKLEVLTGSKSSVNGPHPQRVHRDEVELMDKEVYQESLQMEKSKTTSTGINITSQTLITSTRKTSDGLMQELLDDCKDAEKDGRKAPYKIYSYCLRETMQRQPSCREAYPDLPEEEKCNCQNIQKGEWDSGKPRTFNQICAGAFAKTDGFTTLDDAQKTFSKSSKAMFEAQQLCKRPYSEDVSLEEFSRERHGIRNFEFDPSNGPVYQGIDFGGTNPHSVIWGQILDFEIEVTGFDGEPKRLQEGTMVFFESLYVAEIGNNKLADLIVETERQLYKKHGRFKIMGRFADPQAKAARLDFKDHSPTLKCSWPVVTRDREEHFKVTNDWVNDDFLAVDLDKVEMFVEEAESWNINVKKFDHAVDSGMYLCSNANMAEKKRDRSSQTHLPTAYDKKKAGRPDQFSDNLPGARRSPLHQSAIKEDGEWRKSFA